MRWLVLLIVLVGCGSETDLRETLLRGTGRDYVALSASERTELCYALSLNTGELTADQYKDYLDSALQGGESPMMDMSLNEIAATAPMMIEGAPGR